MRLLLLGLLFIAYCGYSSAHIPAWANASMHWPFNGQAKVSSDGYAGFVPSFQDNAEACPSEARFQCCKCAHAHDCDHAKTSCAKNTRPCEVQGVSNGHGCRHIHQAKSLTVSLSANGECDHPFRNHTAMRRSNVVARAAGWVANGFAYMYSTVGVCTLETCGPDDDPNDCPVKQYQSVCNGLVANAFRLNNQNCDNENCDPIPCSKESLKPGDAMHLKAPHWIFFRKWLNTTSIDSLIASASSPWASKKLQEHLIKNPESLPHFEFWQMGGGYGKVNIHFNEFKTGEYRQCWRRKDLIED